MKKKLTVRGINALKPAEPGKRYEIWDTELANFGVRVTDSGKISFLVMRRIGKTGSPVRRVVGAHRCGAAYAEGLLSQARADARVALRDMAAGIDPNEKAAKALEIAAERAAMTFEAVAEDFILRHVRPHLKCAAAAESAIRREIVPKWRDRPVTEIARRDVVKLLEGLVDDGRRSTAHHVLAYLSKLFNWAIARDVHGLQASPVVRGMAKDIIGAKKPRQRVLSEQEILEVWRATFAAKLSDPFGAFVRLLLVTGQRLREVANAKWAEIDLEAKLWTIPAARMKGGSAHEIPLSGLAIEIIESVRPANVKPDMYVFTTTAGSRPISGFSKAKVALDGIINAGRETPLPGFVFHDLRRTMRTALSGLPIPDNVAELVIAHARPGLHKVYDQHSYRDEKRRALDLWAAKLLSIVEPEKSNVVELVKARG